MPENIDLTTPKIEEINTEGFNKFIEQRSAFITDEEYEQYKTKIEETRQEKLENLERTTPKLNKLLDNFKKKADLETKEKAFDALLQEGVLVRPSFLVSDPIALKDLKEELGNKEWLWENYIAKGHITLLSALWKAGKSTLLRCLLSAMQTQEEFAGQPTFRRKVLIISEESPSEWVEKRQEFNLDDVDDVLIWARPVGQKFISKTWLEFVKYTSDYCIENQVELVIVDTLSTFWPVDNENDAPQMMKCLVPLYNFTEKNIAVLLIHHFRKSGGGEATASRGSGALPGFVDNIIEFTRMEGANFKNTQRLLRTYGRFSDVVPEVVIELDLNENKYITKGARWEVSKIAKVERIITIFEENAVPLCTKDIIRLWDDSRFGDPPHERAVRRYVQELRDKNILILVKEETVRGGKTPFYALKGSYREPLSINFPVSHGTVHTGVATPDNGKMSGMPNGVISEPTDPGTDSVNPKGNKLSPIEIIKALES